ADEREGLIVPLKSEPVEVNIGPQHPSTHGVFRMVAQIDGERITDVKMIVGYLHRSMEKLAEERTYTQNIPFTDRMDYLAEMTCGARITTNYMRIGGVAFDIPDEFLPALDKLVNDDLPYRFDEYDQLLVGNEIILMRARDVGVVTPEMAINAALSGPMLRSAGIAWDLR